MELRHLRYFLAVAEELHFGRAAKRLHIAQPPLSQQIRQLEEELGARLFERTNRRVSLTEAGAAFLVDARDILARTDAATRMVGRLARGEQGRLRVGFVGPATESPLPEAIRDFRAEHPGVVLELRELGTMHQLEELRAGSLDVGFIRIYNHDLNGLEAERFLKEPYILALPEGHRLAACERIRLSELGGERWILTPRHYQPKLHAALMARFAEAGFTPDIAQEAITKQTTNALVAAGIGITIFPASMRKVRRDGVVYRELEGRLPWVQIFTVWDPAMSSPARELFLETVRRHRQADPDAAAPGSALHG